jgi:protoporphyrin/coproporphyrin ferrochelatase
MKLAVVLFNLGGPDRLEAVRPFLFNLFNDPAIIGAPGFVRTPLAALISRTREKAAQANYRLMGGASPLLGETEAQARALEAALAERMRGVQAKCFIAMRYWRPFTADAAAAVAAWAPDEIVLLPLYPQYSTTTSASSLRAWGRAYDGPGRSRALCCYPTAEGFAAAHAARIAGAYEAAGSPKPVRMLFSAHGLPERVIARGDPYQAQVEATARAVAERLPQLPDWQVCYQSRVGPLKWIGPSTPEAIGAAAKAGLGVVVSPIAFVSEHVETLVELDHEYGRLARELGCPAYVRAPALGVEAAFIEGLAKMVAASVASEEPVRPGSGWSCPARWSGCPRRAA